MKEGRKEGGRKGERKQGSQQKYRCLAGCQWLIPIILATQEAEIRRITV
jgi:hypothetical protein